MQDLELLHDGLELMAIGMGFVFVFLTFLIVTTMLMSWVVGRLRPPSAEAVTAGEPRTSHEDEDDHLMVVIGAALHRFRRRH
jgi:oxaloacetate decarboxylase gamma subunit